MKNIEKAKGALLAARLAGVATRKPKNLSNDEVQLLLKALRIAGSPTKLAQWVNTPVSSLNGQTPYAAMQSAEGRKEVDAVLTRIEHGVY
jgi:uncharacterized protein (DUF2384 family)